MGKTTDAIRAYLKVGDEKWANRRRLAIGLIVFACVFIAWSILFENDHEFAQANINSLTNIILLALTIYGGGATFMQAWETKKGIAPPAVQAKKPQEGD